ncbi:hypothetical protein BDN70DRAFT_895657 [Pholiota conissans]|uniref:Uncharacterized protein n=1 Tax=Pholiota conissans TaxID=109636 RepID=A0A9P5Z329_9AGAR|nr:hypothetical protein BDN70DRAFT_895657 [Pholiota conissans]
MGTCARTSNRQRINAPWPSATRSPKILVATGLIYGFNQILEPILLLCLEAGPQKGLENDARLSVVGAQMQTAWNYIIASAESSLAPPAPLSQRSQQGYSLRICSSEFVKVGNKHYLNLVGTPNLQSSVVTQTTGGDGQGKASCFTFIKETSLLGLQARRNPKAALEVDTRRSVKDSFDGTWPSTTTKECNRGKG